MTEIADLRTAGARDTARARGRDAGVTSSPGQPQGSPAQGDIRVLARSTRERISQRMSAQMQAVKEPLWSSSTSALRAISLPEPGDSSSADAREGPRGMTSALRSAGLPAWSYAAVGAATAAAAMFFLLRGHASEPVRTSHDHRSSPGDVTGHPRGAPAPGASRSSPVELEARPMTAGAAPRSEHLPEEPPGEGAGRDGPTADAPGAAAGGEPQPAPGRAREDRAPSMPAADRAASPASERVRRASAAKGGRASARRDDEGDEAHETRERGATRDRAGADRSAPAGAPAEGAVSADDSADSGDGDALDELLAAASGGGPEAGSHTAAPSSTSTAGQGAPGRAELGRRDVKKAMSRIRAEVDACHARFQVPGTVMIRFAVAPDGRVASARAIGPFKGTDTGTCVAAAVKSADFPAYSGAPMTFTYPFLLTP